jgi:Zn-dependent membrane protease YugP
LEKREVQGAKKVLTAAAMTYVAALAVSFAQLLRFFLMVAMNTRRRD